MKKLFALLLAVAMLTSMATIVSAAELTTTSTTTLTTTVQPASYMLNIPENQEIAFGATTTELRELTVTNASGFAEGKNLKVTVTYSAFEAENVATTIPFLLYTQTTEANIALKSGDSVVFEGRPAGGVTGSAYRDVTSGYREISDWELKIKSEDWGKALAGEYTATITFTTEVVVEE